MASEAAYSDVKQAVSRQVAKPAAAQPHPDRHHSNTQPIACVCSCAKPLWVNIGTLWLMSTGGAPIGCCLPQQVTKVPGKRPTPIHPPLSKGCGSQAHEHSHAAGPRIFNSG